VTSRLLKFKSDQFYYSGSLDDSKSIVNRLLIIQSYFPSTPVQFHSQAEDVRYLHQALIDLQVGKREFDLGAGGTSFRFFLSRLSRLSGAFRVNAHPTLLARPQSDLYAALKQLGTDVSVVDERTVSVQSAGWKNIDCVHVKSNVSSQFASAVLLNSWDLDQTLKIHLGSNVASRSFLALTENICRRSGMRFQSDPTSLTIEPKQKVGVSNLISEVDASSVFTLACFAVLFGDLTIEPFANKLGQPDFTFLDFFKTLKINYSVQGAQFKISRQSFQGSVRLDIGSCPDIFPVACAWLSFFPGQHKIFGAPHLVSKESNRIEKTYELLTLAGVKAEPQNDGMIIHADNRPRPKEFSFNPANDHRMAFAASIFAFAGFRVTLDDLDVVNKSFPQFWKILGLEE
jgi:3-phosphoshikimate 1-carboxyvinyltransferase